MANIVQRDDWWHVAGFVKERCVKKRAWGARRQRALRRRCERRGLAVGYDRRVEWRGVPWWVPRAPGLGPG